MRLRAEISAEAAHVILTTDCWRENNPRGTQPDFLTRISHLTFRSECLLLRYHVDVCDISPRPVSCRQPDRGHLAPNSARPSHREFGALRSD